MTLNGVIAPTSPNRTVIWSNSDGLRKVVEDTLILSAAEMYAKECSFCDILFIAIFAKVTENECTVLCIGGRMWRAFVNTILLTHCYFQFQLQVWFSHDENVHKLPIIHSAQRKLKSRIFVLKCCYFVTEFSKLVPTHNRVDLSRNLCTSLLYFVLRVRCHRKDYYIGPPS